LIGDDRIVGNAGLLEETEPMGIWEDFGRSDRSVGRFWQRLDPDTRVLAARSLYEHDFEDEGAMRARADAKAAALMKFRLSTVRQVPVERRARALALTRNLDPEIVVSMLTALHFEHRLEMMVGFLDALGIEHKDGVIAPGQEVLVTDRSRLAGAIDGLFSKYPPEEVELYLVVLHLGDAKAWEMIGQVMKDRKSA
jgi:hypothetical protein